MKHQNQTRTHQDRKLFLSVFRTYLILLLVSILFVFAGYAVSVLHLRSVISHSQAELLSRVRREVDAHLDSVKSISKLLSAQSLTAEIAEFSEEKPTNQSSYVELKRILDTENAILNRKGNSILYFYDTNSVINELRRFNAASLSAYTYSIGYSEQEFRELMQSVQYISRYQLLHPESESPTLVYLEPIIDSQTRSSGVVMTTISSNFLNQTLDLTDWLPGSLCFMVNGDSSLIVSEDQALINEVNFAILSGLPAKGDLSRVTIGGKRYVALGLTSSDPAWRYYFAVPITSYYQSIQTYVLLGILALLITLAIGLILARRYANQLYQPVQNVLGKLRLTGNSNYPEALHSLESAINDTQNDLKNVRVMLKDRELDEKSNFLYRLCSGVSMPESYVLEQMNRFHLTFDVWKEPNRMVLIELRDVDHSIFNAEGFLDINLMNFSVGNVLWEKLGCTEDWAFIHNGDFYTFLPEDRFTSEELASLLQELDSFFRETFNLHIRAYVSTAETGQNATQVQMLQAEEMRQYKQFWNTTVSDILFYEEIMETDEPDRTSDHLDQIKRFINLMGAKNYDEAHALLMSQFDRSAGDIRHFSQERYQILGFISALTDLPEELPDMDARMDALLTAASIEELRSQTDSLFQDIIAYEKNKATGESIPWVSKVRTFIDEHYQNPDLDVTFLAKEFNLTVSHLSRTYKKETGVGLLEYIHLVRISAAKKLLAEGKTVHDTAVAVGYLDARALTRAFKRYEGITPGQYADSLVQKS